MNGNISSKKHYTNELGAIIVEFTIVMVLVAGIVYGLGQQLISELQEYDHYARATEILMGPQERSLVYDGGSDIPLSGSTSPTLQQFMDVIGNFYQSRSVGKISGLFMVMANIDIDPTQGTISGLDNATSYPVFSYYSGGGGACQSKAGEATNWLHRYANGKIYDILDFANNNVPSGVEDDKGRFGAKLYDIDQGAIRTRGYESNFPIIFAVICSDVKVFGFSQQVVTYHTIIPRRHGI